MRHFIIIVLICYCSAGFGQTESYPYKDAYPLDAKGMSVKGYATLTITGQPFQVGEKIPMDIRFTNVGGGGYVFNPFFDGLFPMPAAVAVYDEQRRYLGNYLSYTVGAQAGISESSWVYFSNLGYVGASLWRRAGHIPLTASEAEEKPLKPGKYYLQVIFFNAFLGIDTKGGRLIHPQDGNLLKEHFDTTELFRSNIVEIQLLGK